MDQIPKTGLPKAKVLKQLRTYDASDANYREAKTWSLVYHLSDDHTDFLKQAYGEYFSENALNPMAFKSLKRFETEVINMTAQMLNGPESCVGTMTSGGTESCLLPVLTYREMARSKRRLSFRPEMIVSESAHVAWSKAAKYFDVKIHYAPLREDLRVDLEAVEKLISKNTIMIVGSAPTYPHGVIDPIGDLGQLAKRKNVPLHVDACLGGFLLPFLEMNGHDLPLFDFRISGVTSISADVHKYGFSAKGASIIVYRDMSFLKHQFFVHEDWPGGVFASPALLGTRPGGAYAAAWGAMNVMGEDGYRENARKIMDVTQALQRGIMDIPGLKILSDPEAGIFAFGSVDPTLNIFAIGDQMESRGWHVDRLQKPEALHIMVTPGHEISVEPYLSDLKSAVEHVSAHPELASKGNAAMYGMISKLPLRGVIRNEVRKMMEQMYSPEGTPPLDGSDNPWFIDKMSALLNRIKK